MTYTGDGRFLHGRCIHEGTPVTIRHWQLRDLVSFGSCSDQVFAVRGTQVVSYPSSARPQHEHGAQELPSTSGSQTTVVMDMGFAAACMTCSGGYLAAGGQSGELEVRDLRREAGTSGSLYRGLAEGSVNNALHIAPSSSGGDSKLFVCNNDSTIKVFRLPDMQRLATIQTHVPANYTALSPDGRLLCSVGDCTHGTLYSARESGYEQLSTFDEATDSGMGCCWSPGGDCLAAAFQDGTVVVRDAKAGKTIHKYQLRTASRCVKFSPAPLDLLAFTENEDYAHVVDMRRWDVMQHIGVSTEDGAGAAAGEGGAAAAAATEPALFTATVSGAAPGSASTGMLAQPRSFGGGAPSLASLIRQRGQGTSWSRDLVHAEAAALAVRLVGGANRRPSNTIRMYNTSDPDGMRLMMEPVASRGLDIAGLCWSPDGSRLAVGTDQAVVTFEVDRATRRQFGCGALV